MTNCKQISKVLARNNNLLGNKEININQLIKLKCLEYYLIAEFKIYIYI